MLVVFIFSFFFLLLFFIFFYFFTPDPAGLNRKWSEAEKTRIWMDNLLIFN